MQKHRLFIATSMKLLCVEPSKTYCQLLVAAFSEAGIDVTFCGSGAEALDTINKTDHYDFVTISFYLQDMTAIELIKSIRLQSAYRFTPITLITSETDEGVLHRALAVGVTDIFKKDEIESLIVFLLRFKHKNEPVNGRVLCIEDSVSQRRVLQSQLESIGLYVDCCSTVEDGRQMFQSNPYDLVITDIVFEKDLGGIKLVNNIRRHETEKGDVPILAMSAYDDPVRRIEILNRGANDYITKPILEEELLARVKGLISSKKYLDQLREKQQRSQQESQRLAINLMNYQKYDQLTSLYNRSLMLELLKQDIARAARLGYLGALLYVDLDNFKHINDTMGHHVGDELLKQVAERLRKIQRTEDMTARLDGDDFVMLLTEISKDSDSAGEYASQTAARIQTAIAEPFNILGETIHTQASVGITLYPHEQQSVYDILKQADAARYQAKSLGKNTVSFYSDELQSEVEKQIFIENKLRLAVANNEFYLNYQPVYESSGLIIGCEALIRWRLDSTEPIPPGVFIPIAETGGLMQQIGRWVMETALTDLKAWQASGLLNNFDFMAINCSPQQFAQDSFVADLMSVLTSIDIAPSLLELEITESLLMEDLLSANRRMASLKQLGIRFAVDDFGTGFSSLRYLKQLPIDKLKIDRSFVRDIEKNRNDLAIVETIIAMAKALNLKVVAEGVETQAQNELLIARQCNIMQGFYYGRPMDEVDFRALLQKQCRTHQAV